MDSVIAILAAMPDGSYAAGLVVIIGIMLATGALATRRELQDKNKQIEVLTATNKEQWETVKQAVRGQETIIQMLEGFQKQRRGGPE